VHVLPDLVADDRELAQRGVQHRLLQRGITGHREAETGHQEQQEREQRHEAVVGDHGGQGGGLVVDQLVEHRQRPGQPFPLTLMAVQRFGHVHGSPPAGRPPLSGTRNSASANARGSGGELTRRVELVARPHPQRRIDAGELPEVDPRLLVDALSRVAISMVFDR
jgi:hypothetical protein